MDICLSKYKCLACICVDSTQTVRQLVSGLRQFRTELTDPAGSVVVHQLLLHTDLLLETCASGSLSSDTVLSVTHSIALLQEVRGPCVCAALGWQALGIVVNPSLAVPSVPCHDLSDCLSTRLVPHATRRPCTMSRTVN
jgi:hypothetical protein